MSKKRITRAMYEEYLNELGTPTDECRYSGRFYGTWLRRNEPTAFNVGYNDYCREKGRF